MATLSIILAQLNFTVGDIHGNSQKILTAMQRAINQYAADMIIFPELALSGYPPEDLLLHTAFLNDVQHALQYICATMPENIIAIIGYPEYAETVQYNSAAVLKRNELVCNYRKQELPNYGVFDEKRYFQTGQEPCTFTYRNICFGVTICEDLWQPEPARKTKAAGAQILLSLNASPFDHKKITLREHMMRKRVMDTRLPLLYVNHCCGQDDLIFDGSSFALNAQNHIVAQAPFTEEALLPITLHTTDLSLSSSVCCTLPSREAQIYQALVLGVQDYVKKNKFSSTLLGFSGGIDSALTLAITADALGKDNVLPVLLPSRYTSALSIAAAREQCDLMQLHYQEISIEPGFCAFLSSLGIDAQQPPNNLTTQNLQARCRGVMLMGLSNATQALLLNTSNKSELAVGYGTLYGDMCGGYGVLKDVWKTDVYKLAKYRNQLSPVIPQTIITRPPSAELAPDQLDTDALPAYDILDAILQSYIEQKQSPANIVLAGFPEETVRRVIQLVRLNEYKRRQAPPGPRVTTYAFGRERRFPITSGYPVF